MTDLLFQFGLSNVFLSLVLALAAMAVGAIAKRPRLSHLLWLLVFVKLITPPAVTIPVTTIPGQSETTAVSMMNNSQQNLLHVFDSPETWYSMLDNRKKELSLFWLAGSLVVFTLSLTRIFRFNRLLHETSKAAPQELQIMASQIADRLGMRTVPDIYMTSSHLQPLVWWVGGKVRIFIPAVLRDQMDPRQFKWVLAHELAHVRRRDYMVRWIEWLACVGFWWNPVMWWARYNLRANEELCCDALVITSMKLKRKTYADSLLKAVEYLAFPAHRPPAMASEINSGGFLVKRFKMIVSDKLYRSNPRWMQVLVLFCAVTVIPLSFGWRVNTDAVNELAEQRQQTSFTDAKPINASDKESYRKNMQKKLQYEVTIGTLTEEEAKMKIAYFEKELTGKMKNGEWDREGITKEQYWQQQQNLSKQFWQILKKAVDEGKLTEEEAKMKMTGFKKWGPKRMKAGERTGAGKKNSKI
ncbi:M56 family metallopeptidase [candidate division KSB1 bacterium]